MPSSMEAVTSLVTICPVFLSATAMVVVMGAISSLNLPATCAAEARC